MAIRFAIDTDQYQFSHSRAPRGEGTWAFSFVVDGMTPRLHGEDEVYFAPAGSYTEAKASATRYARSTFGWASEVTLVVLP